MDELVRWLGEQLDFDAAQATEAGEELGPDWHYDDGFVLARREGDMVATGSQDFLEAERGRFIAAHDPARVLAEVDAKRQLLDDYTVTARIRDEAATRIKAAGDHPDPKDLDTWDRAQMEVAVLEGPVKLAALPLADRPGYREEWRP